ncbi:MAG: sodium:solute symporter [Bacteroidetes bacterium 4572_77]|nr:MAG: sodium:solute symporter [Bacteroidetes bacterium 4572_77]
MATSLQVNGTWILIAIYASLVLYFVIKGALSIKNISDYAVGNVTFSPIAIGLSLAASMTSAATFVINPGLIAVYGVSGVLSFGLFFPLASMGSLIILSKAFRKYGQSVNALTMAQWIGVRYKSKAYALFMAFLSLLLVTFIVLILVALTKVLSKSLNIEEIYVLAGLITFVFGYMMFGGANSMVYTNTIQAIIMIFVAFILLGSGYEHFKDGIDVFLSKIGNIDPNLAKSTNPDSILFRDYYEIIFVQLIVGIAVVCQPHIITKSLLLKNEKDVNKFLFTATTVQVLFYAVIIVGLYARLSFPDLTNAGVALKTDGIIPAYVLQVFSNGFASVIIGLIVILGLISAGMSTLEGLIQSVSTTVTTDIIKELFGKRITNQHHYIHINRLVIIVLAIVSFFITYDQIINPKLSVAILAQNGVYAYFSVAFVPILFGIFSKSSNLAPPLAASITALITHFSVYYLLPILVTNYDINLGFFTKYLEGNIRNPAIASSTAIILSAVVGLAIMYFQKKPRKN